jgi:hypothetical protein
MIMTHKTNLIIALLFLIFQIGVKAQDWQTEKRFNVLFGLSQPLVAHGFNVELNYVHNRFIFDFSQGVGLTFSGNAIPASLQQQGVEVHMPWTTGFGIGYRFTDWINLRIEPKWHLFEFNYENGQQLTSNEITSYNTVTLGLGLYGCYLPFKKKTNSLKGIMISPSVRYWPTVNSTLSENSFSYFNPTTESVQQIKTYGPGIKLSPWIVNISIGYSFEFKKKQS